MACSRKQKNNHDEKNYNKSEPIACHGLLLLFQILLLWSADYYSRERAVQNILYEWRFQSYGGSGVCSVFGRDHTAGNR